MATAIEKIDLADVKITREDNLVVPVKSVSVDTTDATKVVIETYTDMADGKVYTVTYTAQDEAKTVSEAKFTATDGKIAGFALSTATVTTNKATTIKYSALDAKGVVIYQKGIGDAKPNGIEVTVTYDNGYVDGSKLVLMATGATAKVNVTYHTYKYDEVGNEQGVITKDFTITAVENSATASKFNYTIVEDGEKPAWENLTVNTKLALGDGTKEAQFQIKDSNNEDITDACGYTVESSNNNIVIASGDVKYGAKLVAVAEGSAYLILKDNSKTVTTLPITVVGKRILASFELDKTSVAIANNVDSDSNGSVSIGYTAKDQYGDSIKREKLGLLKFNCTSAPSSNTGKLSVDDNDETNKIEISTSNATKGTYRYTVTATFGDKKQTKSFSVNVVEPDDRASTSYVLQFANGRGIVSGAAALTSMDTTVTKDSGAAQIISVSLATKKSGVITGPLSLNTVYVKSIEVKGSDGKTYAAFGKGIKDADKVSGAAISATEIKEAEAFASPYGQLFNIEVVTKSDKNYVKNLPAGSYNVEVVLSESADSTETKKVASTFRITDKQPTLIAKVLDTSTDTSSIKTVLADAKFVKYVYGGLTQVDDDGYSLIDTDDIETVYGKVNGNICVVSKVTLNVKVSNDKTVQMTVPVNRVFTSNEKWKEDEVKQ